MVQEKSLCLTYFLWLFFGWFGLHHFYLGRDRHAFVWWSTFGGIFFLGWIRDLWRIREYVDDANEEPGYMAELTQKMKMRKCPPFNVARFAGQLMVGNFYGVLVKMAIPEETPHYIVVVLVSAGIAVGVHIIGNIGREEGGLKSPLIAAILCNLVLRYYTEQEPNYMICSVAAACVFNYFRKYRRTYKQTSFCKRIMTLSWCMFIIFALWACFFYFNAEITTEDGEKVKIRDSVNHFFKSPAWLEFKNTLWELFEEGRKNGWKQLYDGLVKALDPKGEVNARKVLGVTEETSQQEIKQIYKKLVRQWHPDRHKENKEEAQKKFMEIQEAYDVLTSKKKSDVRTSEERTEF